jgi:hypothetical protein
LLGFVASFLISAVATDDMFPALSIVYAVTVLVPSADIVRVIDDVVATSFSATVVAPVTLYLIPYIPDVPSIPGVIVTVTLLL